MESKGMPVPVFLPSRVYDIVGTDKGYEVEVPSDKVLIGGKIDFVSLTETMILLNIYPSLEKDEFFGIRSVEIKQDNNCILVVGQVIKLPEVSIKKSISYKGPATTAQ